MSESQLRNTYERIPHRLDGIDVQVHYMKVFRRIQKYSRRLIRIGFIFNKKKDRFIRDGNHVTLDYVESICDFTDDEFKSKYGA
jgi:hypothetical protein